MCYQTSLSERGGARLETGDVRLVGLFLLYIWPVYKNLSFFLDFPYIEKKNQFISISLMYTSSIANRGQKPRSKSSILEREGAMYNKIIEGGHISKCLRWPHKLCVGKSCKIHDFCNSLCNLMAFIAANRKIYRYIDQRENQNNLIFQWRVLYICIMEHVLQSTTKGIYIYRYIG